MLILLSHSKWIWLSILPSWMSRSGKRSRLSSELSRCLAISLYLLHSSIVLPLQAPQKMYSYDKYTLHIHVSYTPQNHPNPSLLASLPAYSTQICSIFFAWKGDWTSPCTPYFPLFHSPSLVFSLEPGRHLLLSINCHLRKQRKKSYTFQRLSLILQRVTSMTYEFTIKHPQTNSTIHRLSNKCNNTSFKFPRNGSTDRIAFKIQLKYYINLKEKIRTSFTRSYVASFHGFDRWR